MVSFIAVSQQNQDNLVQRYFAIVHVYDHKIVMKACNISTDKNLDISLKCNWFLKNTAEDYLDHQMICNRLEVKFNR